MRILGLTGGSGTGKSTVSALLQQKGAGAVDADAVYRALCAENREMLTALERAFGPVLTREGALDRPALANIVFANPEALRRLNEITTPYIRAASMDAIRALADRPLVLYDAPTLFETGADALCGDVIGVLADRETRVRRVMARDRLSEAAARARIGAQPPDGFYRARCRYLIQNNGALDELTRAVDALYMKLIGDDPT